MKILYVIVLYKCNLTGSKSYLSLLEKHPNEFIYIYDNSPEGQVVERDNVIYIHDSKNSGLGVAYNKAAKYAKENGYEWLLIMDQDTTFPPNTLANYKEAIHENPEIMLFAPIHKIAANIYISPTHYRFKTSHPESRARTGLLLFKDAAPINSGMLINVEAFYKVGGYDEEVILDFSDIRFIEKFRKYYSSFYAIGKIVCLQDFSMNEQDINKLMTRYKIYLKCALACKREHFHDHFFYLYITSRRTMKWTLRTRSLSFLKTYITHYWMKLI